MSLTRKPAPPLGGERVTLAEVAQLAGVSQSAVSRVFTPGASASAKTARKVRAAAEQLGYRPNILARSLTTGKTRIIGLVVAYLDNQFYPVMVERLSHALQERGYHILIILAPDHEEKVEPLVQELLDYQVDGILTASVAMSNALTSRCDAAGIPVVMFNRGQDDPRLSEVTSDNFDGGRQVGTFLAAGGHRRIAHISGWFGSSTGRDRAEGFRQGLAQAGLTPVAVVDGHYRRETAEAITRTLFEGPDRPDAIFAGSDHMALGVMAVLRHELGLSVPKDVSVVGFDDVAPAAWPEFSLTTVAQPLDAMVSATVDTLMQKMDEGPDTRPRKLRLPCRLILRGSARIPEGWST
jgi:DNA-binding LacI/PurR family transcriptional regulator